MLRCGPGAIVPVEAKCEIRMSLSIEAAYQRQAGALPLLAAPA
jgi:hypothetical protein